MVTRISELPFCERPMLELLHFEVERTTADGEYAGYGWGRAARVDLVDSRGDVRIVDDVLVLALHCPDDGEVLTTDIELYFELPDEAPVTVLASDFFARWLPLLPQDAGAIVLALCNPHRAALLHPPQTRLPLHFAFGEVESWQARDDGRIELRAERWQQAEPSCARREGGLVA